MSQVEAQAQSPVIYTRGELEERLQDVNEKAKVVVKRLKMAVGMLRHIPSYLYLNTKVDLDVLEDISYRIGHLENAVLNALDELVISELKLDTDIGKYEREFNIKFMYDKQNVMPLGVVMLKEKDRVKPVVVWINYSKPIIGYSEED
jgi:hypothetical protein